MSEVNQVLHGDALAVLRTLEDNSVDSICTDPPAGINFMNKGFDSDRGGRDMWVAWLTAIMREALRVLRPGGHAFVWALPRTSHWTALALEDAGFEIRDSVAHLFGSGFPKSLDVSKAIDRLAGKEREVIGYKKLNERDRIAYTPHSYSHFGSGMENEARTITAPATPEAQQWEGWGSALKPSHEVWWLCRKPLAEKSIAAQVLATGTGALNIDASRIGGSDSTQRHNHAPRFDGTHYNGGKASDPGDWTSGNSQGKRFPSHLLLSHSLLCVPLGEKRVRAVTGGTGEASKKASGVHSWKPSNTGGKGDDEGMETVEAWQCAEQCPVRLLDEQSGVRKSGNVTRSRVTPHAGSNGKTMNGGWNGQITEVGYGDQGGASRYFQTFPPFIYAPKASRRERNAGCEALPEQATRVVNNQNCKVCIECGKHLPNSYTTCMCGGSLAIEEVSNPPRTNHHPTVKSQQLMQYLCKMITPPNGVVLDCFAGSGSTGVACVQNGFRYILIEQEQEYVDIIHARLAHAHKAMPVQDAAEYECVPECPVRILGEQSGVRKSGVLSPHHKQGHGKNVAFGYTQGIQKEYGGDTGKADRFFKVFPPGSLFEGMDEVSGEQESEQDGKVVT